MAAASPSAVMALPDRPRPERPDPKTPDGSDGQFAGLMAHLNQASAPPKSPDIPPEKPTRSEKAGRVEEPAQGPAAAPTEKPAKSEARTTKPEGDEPPAETAPAPKAEAASPKPEVAEAATKAALEQALAAALPKGKAEAQPPASQVASAQAANDLKVETTGTHHHTQDEAPQVATAPQAKEKMPVPADLPAPGPSKAAPQIHIQTAEPTATGQAKPQAPPPPEAARPEITAAIQAALAESKATAKEVTAKDLTAKESTPAEGVAAKASPKNAGPLPEKATKATEAPVISKSADGVPSKAVMPPTATPTELEAAKTGHASEGTTTHAPEATQASAESLLAGGQTPASSPVVSSGDGSALAAVNTLTKPAEAVPVAPAPAAPPAPPAPPVAQVAGGIRWMLKSGAQEAQLQLHPDSLGQVTIHLKVEGGEVHARLWVTEPASVQAVQEGRSHLEQSLKEQGLQLGSFDLHQGHRPFQEAPSAPAFRGPVLADGAPARQEAPAAPSVSILNPHHVELYA